MKTGRAEGWMLWEPQAVLAETHPAILPLVPYLDTLRRVFIVVALCGIAVTIYARLDDCKRGGGGDRLALGHCSRDAARARASMRG